VAQNVTIAGASYSDVPAIEVPKTGGGTAVFADPSVVTAVASDVASGKYFIDSSGTLTEGTASGGGSVVVTETPDEHGGTVVEITAEVVNLQAKTPSYTPTESVQTETIEADTGYNGLSSVEVTVGAISSSYVGSAIDRRDSTDLSASGATVSVPAGYYENSVSKAVASGTEGTPSATKGTVSSHSISVTPSVTNSAGYISGGTHTGTAVSVSASELVSGTKSITQNGTGIDVTNYASVDVAVPTGSSKAIYKYEDLASRTANSYGATNAKVTVAKAGTYNISYVAVRGSSSGTMGTNLHIGDTAGTNNQTFNKGTYGQYVSLTNQTIAANTDVVIYATSGSNSRSIYVGQLIVEEV